MGLRTKDIQDLKDALELLTREELEYFVMERLFRVYEGTKVLDKVQFDLYTVALSALPLTPEDHIAMDNVLRKFKSKNLYNENENCLEIYEVKSVLSQFARSELEYFALDRCVRLNELDYTESQWELVQSRLADIPFSPEEIEKMNVSLEIVEKQLEIVD